MTSSRPMVLDFQRAKDNGDLRQAAALANVIGVQSREAGRYDEAVTWHKLEVDCSLSIDEKIKALRFLSLAYRAQHAYDKGLTALQRAARLCRHAEPDSIEKLRVLQNLGDLYMLSAEQYVEGHILTQTFNAKALYCFEEAVRLLASRKDWRDTETDRKQIRKHTSSRARKHTSSRAEERDRNDSGRSKRYVRDSSSSSDDDASSTSSSTSTSTSPSTSSSSPTSSTSSSSSTSGSSSYESSDSSEYRKRRKKRRRKHRERKKKKKHKRRKERKRRKKHKSRRRSKGKINLLKKGASRRRSSLDDDLPVPSQELPSSPPPPPPPPPSSRSTHTPPHTRRRPRSGSSQLRDTRRTKKPKLRRGRKSRESSTRALVERHVDLSVARKVFTVKRNCLMNLGVLYDRMADPLSASQCYIRAQRGIDLSSRHPADLQFKSRLLVNMAGYYAAQGNRELAESFYLKDIEVSEMLGFPDKGLCFRNLAVLYMENCQWDDNLQNLLKKWKKSIAKGSCDKAEYTLVKAVIRERYDIWAQRKDLLTANEALWPTMLSSTLPFVWERIAQAYVRMPRRAPEDKCRQSMRDMLTLFQDEVRIISHSHALADALTIRQRSQYALLLFRSITLFIRYSFSSFGHACGANVDGIASNWSYCLKRVIDACREGMHSEELRFWALLSLKAAMMEDDMLSAAVQRDGNYLPDSQDKDDTTPPVSPDQPALLAHTRGSLLDTMTACAHAFASRAYHLITQFTYREEAEDDLKTQKKPVLMTVRDLEVGLGRGNAHLTILSQCPFITGSNAPAGSMPPSRDPQGHLHGGIGLRHCPLPFLLHTVLHCVLRVLRMLLYHRAVQSGRVARSVTEWRLDSNHTPAHPQHRLLSQKGDESPSLHSSQHGRDEWTRMFDCGRGDWQVKQSEAKQSGPINSGSDSDVDGVNGSFDNWLYGDGDLDDVGDSKNTGKKTSTRTSGRRRSKNRSKGGSSSSDTSSSSSDGEEALDMLVARQDAEKEAQDNVFTMPAPPDYEHLTEMSVFAAVNREKTRTSTQPSVPSSGVADVLCIWNCSEDSEAQRVHDLLRCVQLAIMCLRHTRDYLRKVGKRVAAQRRRQTAGSRAQNAEAVRHYFEVMSLNGLRSVDVETLKGKLTQLRHRLSKSQSGRSWPLYCRKMVHHVTRFVASYQSRCSDMDWSVSLPAAPTGPTGTPPPTRSVRNYLLSRLTPGDTAGPSNSTRDNSIERKKLTSESSLPPTTSLLCRKGAVALRLSTMSGSSVVEALAACGNTHQRAAQSQRQSGGVGNGDRMTCLYHPVPPVTGDVLRSVHRPGGSYNPPWHGCTQCSVTTCVCPLVLGTALLLPSTKLCSASPNNPGGSVDIGMNEPLIRSRVVHIRSVSALSVLDAVNAPPAFSSTQMPCEHPGRWCWSVAASHRAMDAGRSSGSPRPLQSHNNAKAGPHSSHSGPQARVSVSAADGNSANGGVDISGGGVSGAINGVSGDNVDVSGGGDVSGDVSGGGGVVQMDMTDLPISTPTDPHKRTHTGTPNPDKHSDIVAASPDGMHILSSYGASDSPACAASNGQSSGGLSPVLGGADSDDDWKADGVHTEAEAGAGVSDRSNGKSDTGLDGKQTQTDKNNNSTRVVSNSSNNNNNNTTTDNNNNNNNIPVVSGGLPVASGIPPIQIGRGMGAGYLLSTRLPDQVPMAGVQVSDRAARRQTEDEMEAAQHQRRSHGLVPGVAVVGGVANTLSQGNPLVGRPLRCKRGSRDLFALSRLPTALSHHRSLPSLRAQGVDVAVSGGDNSSSESPGTPIGYWKRKEATDPDCWCNQTGDKPGKDGKMCGAGAGGSAGGGGGKERLARHPIFPCCQAAIEFVPTMCPPLPATLRTSYCSQDPNDHASGGDGGGNGGGSGGSGGSGSGSGSGNGGGSGGGSGSGNGGGSGGNGVSSVVLAHPVPSHGISMTRVARILSSVSPRLPPAQSLSGENPSRQHGDSKSPDAQSATSKTNVPRNVSASDSDSESEGVYRAPALKLTRQLTIDKQNTTARPNVPRNDSSDRESDSAPALKLTRQLTIEPAGPKNPKIPTDLSETSENLATTPGTTTTTTTRITPHRNTTTTRITPHRNTTCGGDSVKQTAAEGEDSSESSRRVRGRQGCRPELRRGSRDDADDSDGSDSDGNSFTRPSAPLRLQRQLTHGDGGLKSHTQKHGQTQKDRQARSQNHEQDQQMVCVSHSLSLSQSALSGHESTTDEDSSSESSSLLIVRDSDSGGDLQPEAVDPPNTASKVTLNQPNTTAKFNVHSSGASKPHTRSSAAAARQNDRSQRNRRTCKPKKSSLHSAGGSDGGGMEGVCVGERQGGDRLSKLRGSVSEFMYRALRSTPGNAGDERVVYKRKKRRTGLEGANGVSVRNRGVLLALKQRPNTDAAPWLTASAVQNENAKPPSQDFQVVSVENSHFSKSRVQEGQLAKLSRGLQQWRKVADIAPQDGKMTANTHTQTPNTPHYTRSRASPTDHGSTGPSGPITTSTGTTRTTGPDVQLAIFGDLSASEDESSMKDTSPQAHRRHRSGGHSSPITRFPAIKDRDTSFSPGLLFARSTLSQVCQTASGTDGTASSGTFKALLTAQLQQDLQPEGEGSVNMDLAGGCDSGDESSVVFERFDGVESPGIHSTLGSSFRSGRNGDGCVVVAGDREKKRVVIRKRHVPNGQLCGKQLYHHTENQLSTSSGKNTHHTTAATTSTTTTTPMLMAVDKAGSGVRAIHVLCCHLDAEEQGFRLLQTATTQLSVPPSVNSPRHNNSSVAATKTPPMQRICASVALLHRSIHPASLNLPETHGGGGCGMRSAVQDGSAEEEMEWMQHSLGKDDAVARHASVAPSPSTSPLELWTDICNTFAHSGGYVRHLQNPSFSQLQRMDTTSTNGYGDSGMQKHTHEPSRTQHTLPLPVAWRAQWSTFVHTHTHSQLRFLTRLCLSQVCAPVEFWTHKLFPGIVNLPSLQRLALIRCPMLGLDRERDSIPDSSRENGVKSPSSRHLNRPTHACQTSRSRPDLHTRSCASSRPAEHSREHSLRLSSALCTALEGLRDRLLSLNMRATGLRLECGSWSGAGGGNGTEVSLDKKQTQQNMKQSAVKPGSRSRTYDYDSRMPGVTHTSMQQRRRHGSSGDQGVRIALCLRAMPRLQELSVQEEKAVCDGFFWFLLCGAVLCEKRVSSLAEKQWMQLAKPRHQITPPHTRTIALTSTPHQQEQQRTSTKHVAFAALRALDLSGCRLSVGFWKWRPDTARNLDNNPNDNSWLTQSGNNNPNNNPKNGQYHAVWPTATTLSTVQSGLDMELRVMGVTASTSSDTHSGPDDHTHANTGPSGAVKQKQKQESSRGRLRSSTKAARSAGAVGFQVLKKTNKSCDKATDVRNVTSNPDSSRELGPSGKPDSSGVVHSILPSAPQSRWLMGAVGRAVSHMRASLAEKRSGEAEGIAVFTTGLLATLCGTRRLCSVNWLQLTQGSSVHVANDNTLNVHQHNRVSRPKYPGPTALGTVLLCVMCLYLRHHSSVNIMRVLLGTANPTQSHTSHASTGHSSATEESKHPVAATADGADGVLADVETHTDRKDRGFSTWDDSCCGVCEGLKSTCAMLESPAGLPWWTRGACWLCQHPMFHQVQQDVCLCAGRSPSSGPSRFCSHSQDTSGPLSPSARGQDSAAGQSSSAGSSNGLRNSHLSNNRVKKDRRSCTVSVRGPVRMSSEPCAGAFRQFLCVLGLRHRHPQLFASVTGGSGAGGPVGPHPAVDSSKHHHAKGHTTSSLQGPSLSLSMGCPHRCPSLSPVYDGTDRTVTDRTVTAHDGTDRTDRTDRTKSHASRVTPQGLRMVRCSGLARWTPGLVDTLRSMMHALRTPLHGPNSDMQVPRSGNHVIRSRTHKTDSETDSQVCCSDANVWLDLRGVAMESRLERPLKKTVHAASRANCVLWV